MTNPNHKRFFDEKRIPADAWSVLRTAALLSVGEFRVFEIAYRQWYGESGDEKTIEHHFIPYMFKDVVPVWVRHFCGRVLRLDRDGALDPADFGIVARAATRAQQIKGYEYLMWALGALVALVLLGEWTARSMNLQCLFPPCY